ncbi:hypothetical protein MTO96_007321 [Rhipicephalus appendiculatus]
MHRNVHSKHHRGIELARVNAVRNNHRNDPHARREDAAKYPGHNDFAISVTFYKGTALASATILAKCADPSEEAATALASQASEDTTVVFTDLQTAACNNLKGRFSTRAIDIPKRSDTPLPYTCLEGIRGGMHSGPRMREPALLARDPKYIPHDTGGQTESIPLTYHALLLTLPA